MFTMYRRKRTNRFRKISLYHLFDPKNKKYKGHA